MRPTTRLVLATLTEGQDALVTRQQLLQAGVDLALAAREVREGRWSRVHPGLYLTTPGPPSRRQLLRAALLHGGGGSMICGAAACELHGLVDTPPADRVDVLVSHEVRRLDGPHVRVRRAKHLPVPVLRDGFPVVPCARAAVEAARWCGDLRQARAVLSAAVNARRATVEQLVAALAAGGQQGSAVARRAVTDLVHGARSAPEAEVADLLVPYAARGQLPAVLLNPEIWVDGALLGIADLWLVGAGVGHESDSRRHHASGDDLDATLSRHARFDAHGLVLLHTTPKRARSAPDDLVRRVLAACATPRTEPAGLVVVPCGPALPVPAGTPAIGWARSA